MTVARELGRAGVRKVLQRTGIIDESVTSLSTDPAEVVQLLDASWYEERLQKLAAELGRDPESVRAEAAGYLREMAASLDERAVEAWRGFSRWLMRAYDVLVDEDQIAALRKLDRKATLAFAFSHRSYLDGTLLPEVIAANRLTPALHLRRLEPELLPDGRPGPSTPGRSSSVARPKTFRSTGSRCAPTPRSWCKTTPT